MTTQKYTSRKKKQEENSEWDQAISDAQEKINALRFTVRVYKQRRDRGDPWPRTKSADSKQAEA
jgi:hypothetical protein